jgi:hypothetical protein
VGRHEAAAPHPRHRGRRRLALPAAAGERQGPGRHDQLRDPLRDRRHARFSPGLSLAYFEKPFPGALENVLAIAWAWAASTSSPGCRAFSEASRRIRWASSTGSAGRARRPRRPPTKGASHDRADPQHRGAGVIFVTVCLRLNILKADATRSRRGACSRSSASRAPGRLRRIDRRVVPAQRRVPRRDDRARGVALFAIGISRGALCQVVARLQGWDGTRSPRRTQPRR